ncbi:MAG TPA: hypothetical protein VEZ20_14530 [Allosphingosinicella sp.]|jgi:hypothetical protein|nr:hypothetical protein [Allosphingosinicella sp.]
MEGDTMSLRLIAAAALLALSSGCTYWQKTELTGRNHPSGWADQIRIAAVEAYPYAQMSNNAYSDGERYDLGPDYSNPQNVPNDEIGFAYSVFERRGAGQLAEVIIAFRGTEGLLGRDMPHGNLLARQNPRGLAAYDRIRAATDPQVAVNVTGHSLGGGIATHVSLQRPNVKSYIFNASPRFRANGTIPANRRLSIVERGELLKIFRAPGREAPQTYISINCTPGFAPVSQHSIRQLADCLTRIAAWQDGGARASLERNASIGWPTGLPRG